MWHHANTCLGCYEMLNFQIHYKDLSSELAEKLPAAPGCHPFCEGTTGRGRCHTRWQTFAVGGGAVRVWSIRFTLKLGVHFPPKAPHLTHSMTWPAIQPLPPCVLSITLIVQLCLLLLTLPHPGIPAPVLWPATFSPSRLSWSHHNPHHIWHEEGIFHTGWSNKKSWVFYFIPHMMFYIKITWTFSPNRFLLLEGPRILVIIFADFSLWCTVYFLAFGALH